MAVRKTPQERLNILESELEAKTKRREVLEKSIKETKVKIEKLKKQIEDIEVTKTAKLIKGINFDIIELMEAINKGDIEYLKDIIKNVESKNTAEMTTVEEIKMLRERFEQNGNSGRFPEVAETENTK